MYCDPVPGAPPDPGLPGEPGAPPPAAGGTYWLPGNPGPPGRPPAPPRKTIKMIVIRLTLNLCKPSLISCNYLKQSLKLL